MKLIITLFLFTCTVFLQAQIQVATLSAQALGTAGWPAATDQNLFMETQDYSGGRLSLEARRRTELRSGGGIIENLEAPGVYSQTLELGPELELVRCEKKYLSAALIEAAKADRVQITLDRARKEWTVATYLGARLQSSKTVSRLPQIWGMESLPLVFQVLAAGGQTSTANRDLALEVLMSSGDVFGAQVKVHRTGDLAALGHKHKFPPRFRTLIQGTGDLVVFEMGFTGVVGFVYPHKFYYVYKAGAGNPYLAMFGEDPEKTPSYQAVIPSGGAK